MPLLSQAWSLQQEVQISAALSCPPCELSRQKTHNYNTGQGEKGAFRELIGGRRDSVYILLGMEETGLCPGMTIQR